MSPVHTLPSGGTVEMLDVSDLRAKHKRAVQRLLTITDPDSKMKSGIDATDEVLRVVTPSFTEEWLDNLSIADLDAVDKLAIPLAEAMFPSEPSPDDVENPDSPSVPESE